MMLHIAPLCRLGWALCLWLTAVVAAEAERHVQLTDSTPLNLSTLSHDLLHGIRVYDATGAWVGEVDRVITPSSPPSPAAIIEIGGFLGVGETQVLIPLDELILKQAAQGQALRIYVNKSEADLKALPVYHPQ